VALNASKELSSWKELAEYLGVTVRTAQNWERSAGLPVKRLGGEKGRVYADAAELEAWKAARTSKPPLWRNRQFLLVYAVSLTVAALALLAWWTLAGRKGAPADYRVGPNTLAVLDGAGRELWTVRLEHTLQADAYQGELGFQKVWFGNLDRDAGVETLFVSWPENRGETGTTMHCFSEQGAEKWRFTAGRAVSDAMTDFSPGYFIERFLVLKDPGEIHPRIYVTSHHHSFYPNQVAVLDHQGKVLAEYWHSGHLPYVAAADMDGDGIQDLILGGVNNGYKAATVVVLDSRNVSGASVQPGGDPRRLGRIPDACEKARLIFPRSCVNRKFAEYNCVQRMSTAEAGLVVRVMERPESPYAQVIYSFDRNLKLVSLDYSDALRNLHRELFLRREIDHALSEREVAEMAKIVRLDSCAQPAGNGR
jgi:hypothetical protein